MGAFMWNVYRNGGRSEGEVNKGSKQATTRRQQAAKFRTWSLMSIQLSEKHYSRKRFTGQRSANLTLALNFIIALSHSRNSTRAMSTPNKAGAGAKTMSSRLANMKVSLYICFMRKQEENN